MKRLAFLAFFLLAFIHQIFAQNSAKVFGVVKDDKGNSIEYVSVEALLDKQLTVRSNIDGFYLLQIPTEKEVELFFYFKGYEAKKIVVNLKPNEEYHLDMQLKLLSHQLRAINIRDQQARVEGMQTVDPKILELQTNASGNLEGILKMMNGVVSNNELSSEYSVRGGNFDENLVYVNDFEIHRPMLISSSQQEGLTFANPDMVSNLKFSAGGFQARYGDKLSSVLDITYKQPKQFAGAVSLGLLGQSIELEGMSKNKKFSWITGFRNKTNQSLLSSQETQGEYHPVFNDFQFFSTYQFSKKFELQGIVNLNQNKFSFQPQTRSTSFGLINETIRLDMFFEGSETDQFNTAMGGLAAIYHPRENVKLKFLTSGYATQESETYDIIGQYLIGEVQTDISKPNYNQIKQQLGVGTDQGYARNYLNENVFNVSHLGTAFFKNNTLSWGLTAQQENIQDDIKQWRRIDSAGYNIPYSDTAINSFYYLKTSSTLQSMRYSGFFQNNFNFSDTSRFKLITGIRFNYWSLNKELNITPRVQLSYIPNWTKDVIFRLGTGFYYQPAFYKELRNFDGVVNLNEKSQKSFQTVIGCDYNFKWWKRPFSFSSEAYYKYMWDVVPYEINNVQTNYYGYNDAKAFATGIDFRLNGQVVKDAESWISMSYLNTKENLADDYFTAQLNPAHQIIDPRIGADVQDKTVVKDTTVHPGWIRRPTDQRVTVSIFFSDYLPKHPNLKVHLNLLFGTGLPFGPPNHNRYQDTLTMPAYRRVDVGFSAQIFDGNKPKYKKSWKHNLNSIWATLELFNVLGVSNTVSYLWVKDINNTSYAVPNYLTARRVNFKLTCKF